MPPLDWSIVQSKLLLLIIPSFGVAAIVMALACWLTSSDLRRSIAGSLALIAGLAAGLGMENLYGDLIPFLAVRLVDAPSSDVDSEIVAKKTSQWQFETGWYSLFSVAVVASLGEILIQLVLGWCSRQTAFAVATALIFATCAICAIWMTPDDVAAYLCVFSLLFVVTFLNWTTLRVAGQMTIATFIPLFMAMIWCGSAATVILLSHSGKFADLAVLLSCALAGVGAVTVVRRQCLTTPFAVPAAYLPGLMLADQINTYSDIPIAGFVLIAIAPGLCSFLHLRRVRDWFQTRPITLAMTFLTPCAIAVGLAARAELWR